jgi:hypothetical protein
MPLLVAPGFLLAVRTSKPRLLWIYVPLLTFWLSMQPVAWADLLNIPYFNPLFFSCSLGGLLLLIAQSHQPRNAMSLPWRTCGVIMTGSCLLPLSFYDSHADLLGESVEVTQGMLWQAVSILVLTCCAFAAAFRWSAYAFPDYLRRQRFPMAINLLMALMALMACWERLAAEALLPTLLSNAVMPESSTYCSGPSFATWTSLVKLAVCWGPPHCFSPQAAFFSPVPGTGKTTGMR